MKFRIGFSYRQFLWVPGCDHPELHPSLSPRQAQLALAARSVRPKTERAVSVTRKACYPLGSPGHQRLKLSVPKSVGLRTGCPPGRAPFQLLQDPGGGRKNALKRAVRRQSSRVTGRPELTADEILWLDWRQGPVPDVRRLERRHGAGVPGSAVRAVVGHQLAATLPL